jgi:membrane-associated PAP2 superfamily phosphatase
MNTFFIIKQLFIHSQIDEKALSGDSLFSMFLLYFFLRKRGSLMNIDFKEELRKRDELLAGYLKQIEIQEEFIQKQKELIEYLEEHISKITDIVSGV